MLRVNKRSQIFSPGENFSLSGLSALQKSKIVWIIGPNSGGLVVRWRSDAIFPVLNTLQANKSYMIFSRLSGSSFVPYDLPINPEGTPEHDALIVRNQQFFTYMGEQNFVLSGLSSNVRSRISIIYAESNSATSTFATWTPSSLFPTFNSFVKGRTYFIESRDQGFSQYDLGVPEPPVESALEFIDDYFLPEIGLVPADYIEA